MTGTFFQQCKLFIIGLRILKEMKLTLINIVNKDTVKWQQRSSELVSFSHSKNNLILSEEGL